MEAQTDGATGVTGALGSQNRLRLGTFGSNTERGTAMTTIPGALRAEWGETVWAAQTVDRLGFEAIVPLARWKGAGGVTNYSGRNFDVLAWAAGISAMTSYSVVFSTVNTLFMHPLVVAKQMATIDHISGGRSALNVVAGWYRPEVEMFGLELPEHDSRYDIAEEFVEVLRRLWTGGEFEEVSFAGKHFTIREAYSEPKPVRKPHPPIMNAGSSPRSREFTARYADIAFMTPGTGDVAAARARADALRAQAAAEGRSLQVWSHGHIVSRDTDAEAEEYLRWYVDEHGDREAADKMLEVAGVEMAVFSEAELSSYRHSLIAGSGGFEMVGSPERVIELLGRLAEAGCDGVLLSWPDWRRDLPYFERRILPLMEKAGLREPFDGAPPA